MALEKQEKLILMLVQMLLYEEFVTILGEDITKENVQNLSRFIHMRFQKRWMRGTFCQ